MSIEAILGILISALGVLVAVLARIFWARLNAIDAGALEAFKAKDVEREKAWWEWRRASDEERKAWRDEAVKRLDAHANDLRSHDRRLTKLERNGT